MILFSFEDLVTNHSLNLVMKPKKHSNILGILSGLLSLTLIRFPMIARDCALLFSSLLHGNRAGAIIHHLHTCGLWREVSTLFRIIFLITQKVHAKGKTIPYLLKAHDSRLYFTFFVLEQLYLYFVDVASCAFHYRAFVAIPEHFGIDMKMTS